MYQGIHLKSVFILIKSKKTFKNNNSRHNIFRHIFLKIK